MCRSRSPNASVNSVDITSFAKKHTRNIDSCPSVSRTSSQRRQPAERRRLQCTATRTSAIMARSHAERVSSTQVCVRSSCDRSSAQSHWMAAAGASPSLPSPSLPPSLHVADLGCALSIFLATQLRYRPFRDRRIDISVRPPCVHDQHSQKDHGDEITCKPPCGQRFFFACYFYLPAPTTHAQ